MRAVSTVLDVSFCLLLVTASALTLVGTPLADQSRSRPATSPDTADETAETLTTATASVNYSVGDRNRTAHDTLAGLLASAALRDPDSAAVSAFRSAVIERVGLALRYPEVRVQVIAGATGRRRRTDRPTATDPPESTRGESLVVGHSPPPTADVHAARVAVRGVRLTVRTWSP
jgi:hypothetical protein